MAKTLLEKLSYSLALLPVCHYLSPCYYGDRSKNLHSPVMLHSDTLNRGASLSRLPLVLILNFPAAVNVSKTSFSLGKCPVWTKWK